MDIKFLQYFEDTYKATYGHKKKNILHTPCRQYSNHTIPQERTQTATTHTKPDTHTNIKLNPTYESYGRVNSLNLLTLRKTSNIEIKIFRKPTTTDKTINFLSNHPTEHKVSTFRYQITRMHSLPLTPQRKHKEWTVTHIIQQIIASHKTHHIN
jgi:hypothetical protein